MLKSKQNQVPREFETFYSPMLQLKKALQSNTVELEANNNGNQFIIQGLMFLHYATFVMCNLYRITDNRDNSRALELKVTIEDILAVDKFEITRSHVSQFSSFIDSVGKYLNTTIFAKLHIAIYQGYLDYEIYFNLHKELRIFDFRWSCLIEPETIDRMKIYYKASVSVLQKISGNN